MGTTVVTGILVKNAEGKILLVKKKDGIGPYAGTYLTPGGSVKTGERTDEAVQRGLYEEIGIKVTNIKRVLFDDDVIENPNGEKLHYIMLLYTGNYVSGDLQPTENNDHNLEIAQWFSPKDLVGLPLSPPLQKLLAVIGTWKNKFIFHSGLYVK